MRLFSLAWLYFCWLQCAVEAHGYIRRLFYIKGSSRRRLPRLLASLGQIDLLVHDSLHTVYNTCFELDQAGSVLRPGGAVVADDIDLNWAFHSFARAGSTHPFFICRSSPLQSDPSRFDGSGLFGIVSKRSGGLPPTFQRGETEPREAGLQRAA